MLQKIRNFIIAHLPYLEFLDYRLIDEKMRGEALEAYKELVQVMGLTKNYVPFDPQRSCLICHGSFIHQRVALMHRMVGGLNGRAVAGQRLHQNVKSETRYNHAMCEEVVD